MIFVAVVVISGRSEVYPDMDTLVCPLTGLARFKGE